MTGLVVLTFLLIGLLVLIAAPIFVALLVTCAVLKLVFFVLFLPFRLLGGLIGLAVRGFFVFAGIGLLLLLGLPLLPLLIVAGAVYLVFRAMRPGPRLSSSPGS
jgi:hypothetical protein